MTSFGKTISAALCTLAVAGAAAPASAEPFHPGWGPRPAWGPAPGWRHDGWGPGRVLAVGGLGLATGALLAGAYAHPVVSAPPVCGETVSTHYNSYGELVKVVTRTPC